jgi:hypothetical protein
MPPLALFGIDDGGLNLAVNMLVLFLVVIWLALGVWTYLDARRRITDGVIAVCATIGSFIFPYVGAIVYAILRPPEFLDDARERELETLAAELRVRQLREQSCPNCRHPIGADYLRCPSCRVRLKDPCPSCEKPLDPRWKVCPYCEMPLKRAERDRSGARRGRSEGKRRAEPARAKRRTAEAKEKGEPARSRRSESE